MFPERDLLLEALLEVARFSPSKLDSEQYLRQFGSVPVSLSLCELTSMSSLSCLESGYSDGGPFAR